MVLTYLITNKEIDKLHKMIIGYHTIKFLGVFLAFNMEVLVWKR